MADQQTQKEKIEDLVENMQPGVWIPVRELAKQIKFCHGYIPVRSLGGHLKSYRIRGILERKVTRKKNVFGYEANLTLWRKKP